MDPVGQLNQAPVPSVPARNTLAHQSHTGAQVAKFLRKGLGPHAHISDEPKDVEAYSHEIFKQEKNREESDYHDNIAPRQHGAFDCLLSWITALLVPAISIVFTGYIATMDMDPDLSLIHLYFVTGIPLLTVFYLIYSAGCAACMGVTASHVQQHGGWKKAVFGSASQTFALVFLESIPWYVDLLAGAKRNPLQFIPGETGWQVLVFKMYVIGAVLPIFCA